MKSTVIIMAANVKEAKQISLDNYGANCQYIKPYRYASKGNNFYEFQRPQEATEDEFVIQDDIWPSRFWNRNKTQYTDLG